MAEMPDACARADGATRVDDRGGVGGVVGSHVRCTEDSGPDRFNRHGRFREGVRMYRSKTVMATRRKWPFDKASGCPKALSHLFGQGFHLFEGERTHDSMHIESEFFLSEEGEGVRGT